MRSIRGDQSAKVAYSLSDMFGGGMTSSLNSSGMASKNLIRLTVTVSIIWVVAIVLYGLALRFNGQIVF